MTKLEPKDGRGSVAHTTWLVALPDLKIDLMINSDVFGLHRVFFKISWIMTMIHFIRSPSGQITKKLKPTTYNYSTYHMDNKNYSYST